jgi:CheY-like chemotaxis protein
MSLKKTILVADDEAAIREVLAIELEASYDVLVARDGLDAICLYERNVERVAAIVTDLDMPRLNGGLVTEWIHHISPQLPIIVISGQIRNVDLEDILQNPFVCFLAKPFEPSELEALLDRALRSRRDEAA